jgi:hypothetical protein
MNSGLLLAVFTAYIRNSDIRDMKLLYTLAVTAVVALPQFATAATCPIGGVDSQNNITRTAEVTPSASPTSCATVNGNVLADDINGAFSILGDWGDQAIREITGDNAVDSALEIEFTTGGWNEQSTSGGFSIDNRFWSFFNAAIISIHVGNGNPGDNPAGFMFLIEDDTTMGEFSTECSESNTGCGFSNIKLWGVAIEGANPMPKTLSAVPVPAAAWLFGSALLSLGLFKRKRT